MTEDDTFRKLRQIPFKQLWLNLQTLDKSGKNVNFRGQFLEILEKGGWTHQEYIDWFKNDRR